MPSSGCPKVAPFAARGHSGAAPRRDYELYELPSGAAPASAAQLEEEKRVLREHIATKYKLFQQAFPWVAGVACNG